MPQYYSGANSVNSFAAGAMAGFELFDRARARRQEAQDRQRAIALEDERMDMARERHGADMEDRANRLALEEEQRVREGRLRAGKRVSDMIMYYGGPDNVPDSERDNVLRIMREGDPSFANMSDDEVLAAAPTLAMEATDDLEGVAIKKREQDEQKQRAIGLAGLIQGQQGAPTGAGASPAIPGTTASTGSARGLRNNNPGNLRATNIAWQGKTGNDGEFEVFESPEAGLRAASVNLATGGDRGANTVRSAISRWAPSNENDTEAYIAAVSEQLGVDPDEPLDLRDPNVNAAVLGAIVGVENGEQPFTQEQLLQAAQAATGEAPVETVTVTASRNTDGRQSLLGVQAAPRAQVDPITRAVDATIETVAGLPKKAVAAADNATVRNILRPALDPQNHRGNDIRANPLQYHGPYMKARDGFSPTERQQMDALMFDGITAQLNDARQQLESGELSANARARQAARVEDLRAKKDELHRVRASETARTSLPRPVAPGKQAADAGIAVAAERAGASNATTEAALRGMHTRSARMAENPPKRLSAKDIEFLADALVHGVITQEQYVNMLTHGRMDKPSKPTIQALGNGVAAVVNDDGIHLVDTAGSGGAEARKDTEDRLRSKERMEHVNARLTAMVEAGEFDPVGGNPKPSDVYGGLLETVTRERANIERVTGISFTNPTDKSTTWGNVGEGETEVMLRAYKKYRSEELDAMFPDGQNFTFYLAQELGVDPSRAAQASGPAVDGVYTAADGSKVRFKGGDWQDPDNYEPVD